jgi:2-(1,2-epoxy-1,2-dihydrophenyl)acetyl-CoA isomerase
MSAAAPAVIELSFRDRIAFLRFVRPEAANTIGMQFGRELLAAAFAIEAAAARAVVLSGEGRNFCFGGDLKGMVASGGDVQAYLSELTTNLHAAIVHLARLDAPVIAAVNGSAAGAGMGLVLAADYAIAARGAKFVAAYTAVGLTPDASCTFLLPRAVGYKRAMELLLTNRVLDAGEALDWGLINEVVDDDKLAETAAALAARFAAGPVGAVGAVKRLLAEADPGLEAQLGREGRSIAARGTSTEGREGIAAFLEKRAPRF